MHSHLSFAFTHFASGLFEIVSVCPCSVLFFLPVSDVRPNGTLLSSVFFCHVTSLFVDQLAPPKAVACGPNVTSPSVEAPVVLLCAFLCCNKQNPKKSKESESMLPTLRRPLHSPDTHASASACNAIRRRATAGSLRPAPRPESFAVVVLTISHGTHPVWRAHTHTQRHTH